MNFVVKDSDPVKPDDILGKLTLSYDQFLPDGFVGEMQLEQAGDGCEAFLKFEIAVGEKREEPLEPAEAIPAEAVSPLEASAGNASQEDLVDTKVAPKGLCC